MANDAEGQEKQRDNLIQKDHILPFQGPTAPFAIQICLYHVTVSCKGPISKVTFKCTQRFWRENVCHPAVSFLPGNRMPTGVSL